MLLALKGRDTVHEAESVSKSLPHAVEAGMGLVVDVAGVDTREVHTIRDRTNNLEVQDRMYLSEAFAVTIASKLDTWHVTAHKILKAVRVFPRRLEEADRERH
jgi:hypothetical protein